MMESIWRWRPTIRLQILLLPCTLFSILCLSISYPATGSAQDADAGLATDGSLPPLPLPQHSGRAPENKETTRPRESQPNRESRLVAQKQPASQNPRTREMPVPGKPGRGLVPLDELESASSAPLTAEQVDDLGLFSTLPHQIRDGGITFEYIYTGETFTKDRGGLTPTRRTNYRSNFDLVGTLNTAKMGWWDNGRLFVYGQNLSGRPLSKDDVGDVQLFSNLDSTISNTQRPTFTTIAEYWYEHLLHDGRFRVKVGKQDANVDFALSDLGGDFVNSSFGLPPMIPLPTFPSQALGITGFLNLSEKLTFGFGVLDGTLPSGPQGVRWGFDTLGHNGVISLYQLEWKPALGADGQLPTTVRTGIWHHSDKEVWVELSANPNPVTFNQNYGTWTTADQMIWKESDSSDDDQGLGLFGQFGWAPGDRNLLQEYYGGGAVYKGLLPGRDSDLIGFGVAAAMFSSGTRTQNAAAGIDMTRFETDYELFYKYQHSKFISLQPDMQYISNPGGLYKDTLVGGLRFEVVM
jgi:porin